MVEIIKNSKPVKSGSKIPIKEILESSDDIKEMLKIKPLSENKKEVAKFYLNEPLTINHKDIEIYIENPMVYAGIGNTLPIAVDINESILNGEHKNPTFLSADYKNFTGTERFLYLKWLASNRTLEVKDPKLLVLFFRNLQYRAVNENMDKKPILLELLRMYEKYKGSHYYFNTNILELIVFLILSIEEKFSDDETKLVVDFIEKYKTESDIEYFYFSLLFKLKNMDLDDFVKKVFGIDCNDESKSLNAIYNMMKFGGIFKSKIKNLSVLNKSLKKIPIFLVAMKVLLKENNLKLDENNLEIKIRKTELRYNNYYLMNGANTYFLVKNFTIKASEALNKVISTAADLVEEFEENRGLAAIKKGKYLSDTEKVNLLPASLREYFNQFDKKKPKKEEKKFEKVELSLNEDKICLIRENTQQVQCVLSDVFDKDDEQHKIVNIKIDKEELPKKYQDFIDFVTKKSKWERKELMKYSGEVGLMLNEAIDRINEYWDEKFGDYLLTEEEEFICVKALV